MDATLDGLLLAALLLIPGFAHFMISRTVQTWDEEEPTESSIAFISLGATAVLVSVEVLCVGILAKLSDSVREDAADLFRAGLVGFGAEHPVKTLVGLPSIFLFNSIVLGGLGAFDPFGKFQQALLNPYRIKRGNAWYAAFRPTEVASEREKTNTDGSTFVEIRMKGEKPRHYRGAVGAFDIQCDKSGDRYIQLWNPLWHDGTSWKDTRLTDSLSSVLIRSSDVASIEFTYDGVPHGLS